MKTIEETIQEILAEHHECRWMDSSELENCLRRIATEQKAIDEEVIHAIVEEQVLKAINKQKTIDDANLAEVKRQRDEYYDELQKLRRHKVELIEWLNEEASRCREWAKTGYDGYEIGTLEGKYTQAEDTIDKIKGMEE